jgi:hypothetical protein
MKGCESMSNRSHKIHNDLHWNARASRPKRCPVRAADRPGGAMDAVESPSKRSALRSILWHRPTAVTQLSLRFTAMLFSVVFNSYMILRRMEEDTQCEER